MQNLSINKLILLGIAQHITNLCDSDCYETAYSLIFLTANSYSNIVATLDSNNKVVPKKKVNYKEEAINFRDYLLDIVND